MYPYIITKHSLSIYIDNNPVVLDDSTPYYGQILDAIKSKNKILIRKLIDKARTITQFTKGKVTVEHDVVTYNGKEIHNTVTNKILQCMTDGFDEKPIINFLENLLQNPSNQSINELYGFLDKHNLPITPEGCFLAYKAVRNDFKDHHTGTMDNSPGKVVTMERDQVNDDRNETCSHGLHFCSLEYFQYFYTGDSKYITLVINPKDVVSIPRDYNDSKGRCCQYTVLEEFYPNNTNFTVDFCDKAVYSTNSYQPSQPRDSKGRFLGYGRPLYDSREDCSDEDYINHNED